MNTTHRIALWLRRAARGVIVTGAMATAADASAQAPARPILLAPQPLTMATGETGYVAREPAPRVTRGAAPDTFPVDDANAGPELPSPTPGDFPPMMQSAPPAGVPPLVIPNGGRIVSPSSLPPGFVRTGFPPNQQRTTSQFGSGWRNLMSRLFGTSQVSQTSRTPQPAGGRPLTAPSYQAQRPPVAMPPMPLQASQQPRMAYRWYGYGAPIAVDAPQIGERTQMPATWYEQTGATAGAMPNGNSPQPTAMAAAPMRTIPFENAYGPLVRANYDAGSVVATEQPRIGAVLYEPPTPATRPQPPFQNAVAQATARPHDLVPPPPLPPVRWQSPNNDVPPTPVGTRPTNAISVASNQQQPMRQAQANQATSAQRPLVANRSPAANLMPPRPMQAQAGPRNYVARGQSESDEAPSETLADRIQKVCGQYAKVVEVQATSQTALKVTLVVGQTGYARPLADRIGAMPELAAYEIDFEVRTAK